MEELREAITKIVKKSGLHSGNPLDLQHVYHSLTSLGFLKNQEIADAIEQLTEEAILIRKDDNNNIVLA